MKKSKRMMFGLAIMLAGLFLSACAPTIQINNNANLETKVAVFPPGGSMQIVTVSSGESIGVEYTKAGSYMAAVIKSLEWIDNAKQMRDYLISALADSKNMTAEDIARLTQQLRDYNQKISDWERTAEQGSSCTGSVDPEKDTGGIVNINNDSGKIVVICQ